MGVEGRNQRNSPDLLTTLVLGGARSLEGSAGVGANLKTIHRRKGPATMLPALLFDRRRWIADAALHCCTAVYECAWSIEWGTSSWRSAEIRSEQRAPPLLSAAEHVGEGLSRLLRFVEILHSLSCRSLLGSDCSFTTGSNELTFSDAPNLHADMSFSLRPWALSADFHCLLCALLLPLFPTFRTSSYHCVSGTACLNPLLHHQSIRAVVHAATHAPGTESEASGPTGTGTGSGTHPWQAPSRSSHTRGGQVR